MPTKKKVSKKSKPQATKRTTVTKKSAPRVESFKIAPETVPFVTFKITDQTVYWLVLVGYVSLLSLWVLKIHLDTLDILNKINL
jgi:hypothetical protein